LITKILDLLQEEMMDESKFGNPNQENYFMFGK